jgi:hypothetical protein
VQTRRLQLTRGTVHSPARARTQERRLRSLKLMDEGGKSTYDPFNDTFQSW